ncbi:MAG: PD-(D/E)XK nuclease domain-containing protein [Limisphaerales bacterium]
MSRALSQSLARDLEVIREFLRRNVVSLSPELGFAAYVFDRLNTSPPFSFATSATTLEPKRLDQAPILAATGFFLAIKSSPIDKPSSGAWAAAFQRLSKRDPFPSDRASFAYRPLEVVGIALGMASSANIDPTSRDWFKEVLGRLQNQQPANLWNGLLYAIARCVAGLPANFDSVGKMERLSLAELALLHWANAAFERALIPAIPVGGEPALDQILLETSLKAPPAPHDLAEAALLHISLSAAIATRLESALAETWQVGRPTKDAVALIETLCRRFPFLVKQLSARHDKRPPFLVKDEYDVQDLLHGLLRLHFDDVRPEEVTPSYAGSSARMDFLLKAEKVVVEAKMTRKTLGQKEVVTQLTEDVARYRTHPDCQTLVCFVFDPGGFCKNPVALENDVSTNAHGFAVKVIVAPYGL